MKNFKPYIMTYYGKHLKYNSLLSTNARKVYKSDNEDVLTICTTSRGVTYTVEILYKGGDKQYITVESRKGVYAVLTYYELLSNRDEVDYLISQYGTLQHYFDDICCTTEYIKEKYF